MDHTHTTDTCPTCDTDFGPSMDTATEDFCSSECYDEYEYGYYELPLYYT